MEIIPDMLKENREFMNPDPMKQAIYNFVQESIFEDLDSIPDSRTKIQDTDLKTKVIETPYHHELTQLL